MKSRAYREKYKEWRSVKTAIAEILDGGASSATLSSGSGSQSYTRLDLDLLNRMEVRLRGELHAIDSGVVYARLPKTLRIRFR